MGVQEWMKESIEEFFGWHPVPSQTECDQKARSLLETSSVCPVGMQGSLSYTLIANDDTIVSFRIHEGRLGGKLDRLAKKIHGDIMPEATFRGILGDDGDKTKQLLIYTMPYLPGLSTLEAIRCGIDLDDGALIKHINFVRHLARYFARNWLNPQAVDTASFQASCDSVLRKLEILEKDERFKYLDPVIKDLRGSEGVSLLFSERHPQVLNHQDLSETNILLDKDTLSITGIIDWSLAAIQPFGMELAALRRISGSMNAGGWSDYTCREITDGAFWTEFWKVTGIADPEKRRSIREHAVLACKLGHILQFAFNKTLAGEPLDELVSRPARYLQEWLKYPLWSDLVLRKEDCEVLEKKAKEENLGAKQGE